MVEARTAVLPRRVAPSGDIFIVAPKPTEVMSRQLTARLSRKHGEQKGFCRKICGAAAAT
jgi:hypothetical protein